ncbi:MAG: aspartate-semialdehyde dehydrogenase [Elusimicrobia bacterium]|nr:aspartate-semialdehyde dehydrogenase [Elusimicrobiota bacterium]
MSRHLKGPRVAVVGATGLVGREILDCLESLPRLCGELLPFSSGRDPGAAVAFRGRKVRAPGISRAALKSADLVFMVSSDEVSLAHSRALAASGVWVIDDSAAFRMDKDVPLVIPEVNADALSPRKRLIAGPNCTVTGPAVAGFPIAKAAGARAVRISSYQAVSGAGREALEEFARQLAELRPGADGWRGLASRMRRLKAKALPRPIALNVIPQVGSFDDEGHSGEETKVSRELRKIWGMPGLRVSVSAVRVPVLRGHSVAFWLETRRPVSPARAWKLLRGRPGIVCHPKGYATARDVHGTGGVEVSRIRAGTSPAELCLWVVSDNLLKGAASNSVQIAELLLKKGWLR